MKNRRITQPYIPKLDINDLIKLQYDKRLKELQDQIIQLEERIQRLECLSSNITPRANFVPMPSLSPITEMTPNTEAIKDFHLLMRRENAESFENLEIEN